jgi:hypothetical protein
MKLLITLLVAIFMPIFAFAQEMVASISNEQFLLDLLASVGGLKGASALVIAGVVVQLLLKLLKTPIGLSLLKGVKGAHLLTAVLVLTVAGGVIGLMTAGGLGIGAALLHSSTLAAFSVLLNQVYQQYIEKK